MSIEQAPLHTIRMSTKDWNELLVTAVNAGYKSRTEYIRATLSAASVAPPWSSKPPPADLDLDADRYKAKWQASTASLEVYSSDAAKFLTRAETAENEASELRDEITRLQAELQAAKSISITPIMENPNSTKKPVHRFSLSSIVKRWPEARQNRYSKLGSPPDEWLKAALETAYDMLDELGA